MRAPPSFQPTDPPAETLNTTLDMTFSWADRLRILFGSKAHIKVKYDLWIVALPDPETEQPKPHVIFKEAVTSGHVDAIFPERNHPDVALTPEAKK